MKFLAYKLKDEDRLLALMSPSNWQEKPSTIGMVRPGVEANYYHEIVFLSADRGQYMISPEDYLELLIRDCPMETGFEFHVDQVEIVTYSLEK